MRAAPWHRAWGKKEVSKPFYRGNASVGSAGRVAPRGGRPRAALPWQQGARALSPWQRGGQPACGTLDGEGVQALVVSMATGWLGTGCVTPVWGGGLQALLPWRRGAQGPCAAIGWGPLCHPHL